MSKRGQSGVDSPIAFSPVHTRRSSGKKGKEQKDCLQSDSSENAVKEPLNKRQRQNETKEERVVARRPRTRSFNLDVAVPLTRSEAVSKNKVKEKNQGEPSRCIRGTKKKRDGDSPRQVATAVRRSERESRKVFDSLNEHTLVRTLVGDYLVERKSGSSSKRRPLLEEGETDSQEEPGYVSMYDMIKNKGKSDKSDGEDDEDNEEKGSDDDNSSDENEEEEDDDDVTPQQRYTLRQNKPVTKRYTAPPLKEYHSSRRGLFSRHMRERECSRKEPFSPVRKSYKLKRKTINESSTSTDDDDEDNRKFERRKAKSMAKARNRCLPMNLGLEDLSKGTLADRERIGSSLADVDPMNVDRSITFDSIGGLGKHVRSLKEMVVFPLLYPEVFDKFKVNPPRGVLFHGPPGTGKTLMARALANECSQEGKRVAFFMRKGADCLSKWVGESERQLRLLFDQAFKMRPSIIFFDEIDGLAPVRSSRQDQIHSSIVSTLLALMDGLDNRGEIVVIGATNRIDSIDPALRRPGRFDREFIFPLPDKNARRSILTIHTKAWQPRLTQGFINEVADQCVGYCGADIKALCTEAALFALRRRYPQIYASKKKLVLDVNTVRVSAKDFVKGIKTIVPACQRAVVSPGRTLSCTIRPLLCEIFSTALAMVTKIFPPAVCKTVGESSPGSSVNNFAVSDTESSDDGTDDDDIYELDPSSSEGARAARAARAARRAGLKGSTNEAGNRFHSFAENPLTSKTVHCPRYLVCGGQGMCQSTHVSPAILHSMEHLPVHCLDLPALFGCASKTPEEACAQVFREARRVAPSIIYLPRIESLWNTTTDTLKATFLSLVNDLPPSMPLLLFATSDQPASRLPHDLSWLFSIELDQVFEVPNPSAKERWAYFEPLFLTEAVKLPCLSKKTKSKKPLEVLAVASPPTPRELNANELQKVREDEENTLRELRIFLREITVKLMSDRKFKEFYKPVDLEEVPDYLDVIKDPMDLSTMLQKVDGHQYLTCGEYLNDIDLITSNALEYNPNQDPLDRIIRHRACALKDCAHSLIKSQLDVDFEKACEEIAASRKRRGDSRNVLAPKFLPVAPAQSSSRTDGAAVAASTDATQKPSGSAQPTRASRRVRGLSASVDIPLEYLPIKSIPSSSRLSAVESKVSLEEGADSVKKISNKRRRRGGRRIRRSKTSAVRKATPSKFILEPEHSGPEVEPEHSEPGVEPENFRDYNDAGDTGEVKAVKGDDVQLADEEEKEKNESNEREHNGIDEYGENEESENEGDLGVNDKEDEDKKRDDKLNEKDSVEDEDEMSPEETTEKCNDDDKQQENCLENETELKNKSASEDGESLESGSVPDSCTKNYINSLHVRSEVKSALRFRLDSLNCEHDVREETDRHLNGKDKESLSENNFSLATSELSNCDSKDFAELESMLSTSPLPVNGVAMLDDAATTKTFAESTIMANGDHSLPEKRISGGDKLVVNSDEKSKRVLFTDKSEIHEITSEDSDPDIEMSSPEPSQEDRGRFEAILMNLVEMTKDVTIETLERYHSSIRQCILQHKKDDSRQPLLADLKSLLAKFEALNSNSST